MSRYEEVLSYQEQNEKLFPLTPILKIRKTLAIKFAPWLVKTGNRFSKRFRWESTWFHALVYRFVDTILANRLADAIESEKNHV